MLCPEFRARPRLSTRVRRLNPWPAVERRFPDHAEDRALWVCGADRECRFPLPSSAADPRPICHDQIQHSNGGTMTVRPDQPARPPWHEQVQDSSGRLIDAAIDAFAERGYHATTTRDIATRVGLSPAALYVHFPSKQALLTQISMLGHEAAVELVNNSMDGVPDPLGRLRAVVHAFAAWHAEHYLIARVVQHELAALPDDKRRAVIVLRQRIERQVQQQLEDGVAAGQMTVADPRAVTRALLSLSVDVARWYDPKGEETPEGIGTLYADLATRMVGAQLPGSGPEPRAEL
jgi:AcrR family transcriptional regulator